MKNLAKLNGAKALSKNEQKSINGGGSKCNYQPQCVGAPNGKCCTTNSGGSGYCSHSCCRPSATCIGGIGIKK